MRICRFLFGLFTGYLAIVASSSLHAQAFYLSPSWVIHSTLDNSDSYLFTNSTARGLAYNPTTDHILVASRNPTNGIHILDSNGYEIGALDLTGVTNGPLPLNLVSVAEDGVIFAANLTTDSSTTAFKIYRWGDEYAAPDVIFSGDINGGEGTGANARYGDSLDVRGSTDLTQIIVGSRGTNVVLLTTFDGINFIPHILHTDIQSGDILPGIAFGDGNTFWTKANSRPLRQLSFDLLNNTAKTIGSINLAGLPANSAPIGVDPARHLLAVLTTVQDVNYNHTLRLYYIANPADPVLLDTRDYPDSDGFTFPNLNGTGAMDFGAGRLFIIEENNSVVALNVIDHGETAPIISKQPVSQTNFVGASVFFGVTVTNASQLNFQWRHDGVDIPDATNGALVLKNLRLTDAGTYSVVVGNAFDTVISSNAVLSIQAVPSTVIIESRTAIGGVTANPPYQELAAWSSSSAHTGAAGATTAAIGSRFFSSTNTSAGIRLTPTLEPGGRYALDISHVLSNASSNLVVNVSGTGCTISVTNTTNFNNFVSSPVWERVGIVTLSPGVSQPSITFTYASGFMNGTGGRWYSDAFRFVNQSDPCTGALPELTTVNGPLAAGQTFVNVPAVAATATRVRVFADGVQIGQLSSGVVAGVNRVPTSALAKGQIITATQADSTGIDSCRPTTGPIVGGGANTHIRVSLSIRENTALTGPIGANGGVTGSTLKFIAATNTYLGSVNNAPLGGKLLTPGPCWQTVTFDRAVDPIFGWSGQFGATTLSGDFGVFESLAFALDDPTDTGPYRIYIDNVKNGSTVIQDFEGRALGAKSILFTAPSFSGSTGPYLLSQAPGVVSPDISEISNVNADSGTNSEVISWQFKDRSLANWLRLSTQGSGTPNPEVDLRLPITMRMLVLPVGQTTGGSARGPLSIQLVGTNARIDWNSACGGGVLEWTEDVTGQWEEVPGPVTAGPYEYDTFSGPTRFFRLRVSP